MSDGPCVCSLSEEEYSDDEDVSWKVRRAAAKCLQAIIASYPDLLNHIYPQAASALIARFREREETVKSDIFQTFIELIKQVGGTARRYEGAQGAKPVDQLRSDMPSIMKAAVRQLKDKSAKTKQGMFATLQELVAITPDSIGPYISQVMPGIQAALQVSFCPVPVCCMLCSSQTCTRSAYASKQHKAVPMHGSRLQDCPWCQSVRGSQSNEVPMCVFSEPLVLQLRGQLTGGSLLDPVSTAPWLHRFD